MKEKKFRLRLGIKVVGYEKWYGGAWCKGADNAGYWQAQPCWLYSKDNEHWTPKYIYHEQKDRYTGLTDKNGKEIYEGDLIKDTDSDFVGEVIWDDDTLCFTTKFQSNELWGFVPRKGKDNHCEVIGNIWEQRTVRR